MTKRTVLMPFNYDRDKDSTNLYVNDRRMKAKIIHYLNDDNHFPVVVVFRNKDGVEEVAQFTKQGGSCKRLGCLMTEFEVFPPNTLIIVNDSNTHTMSVEVFGKTIGIKTGWCGGTYGTFNLKEEETQDLLDQIAKCKDYLGWE